MVVYSLIFSSRDLFGGVHEDAGPPATELCGVLGMLPFLRSELFDGNPRGRDAGCGGCALRSDRHSGSEGTPAAGMLAAAREALLLCGALIRLCVPGVCMDVMMKASPNGAKPSAKKMRAARNERRLGVTTKNSYLSLDCHGQWVLGVLQIFFGLPPYFEPQISLRRPLILNKILIEN